MTWLQRNGMLVLIAIVGGFTALGILGSLTDTSSTAISQGTANQRWHAIVDLGDGRGPIDQGWTAPTKADCEYRISMAAKYMQEQADAARETDENTYIAATLVAYGLRNHHRCEIEP